jgi:Na+-driven multidrug efflux pump
MTRSPFYRILVLLLCYAILGVSILVPLAMNKNPNIVLIIIIASVLVAAFVATTIIVEIQWARKYKQEEKEKEDAGE